MRKMIAKVKQKVKGMTLEFKHPEEFRICEILYLLRDQSLGKRERSKVLNELREILQDKGILTEPGLLEYFSVIHSPTQS